MEFTSKREALLKALTTTKQALGTRGQHEILQNVLVSVGPEGVFLETTDMETRITCRVPGSPIREHGACLVGHKALVMLLRAAPKKSEITFSCAGHAITIAYDSTRIEIVAYPIHDFPKAHALAAGVEVPAAAFCSAIGKVLFSASKDAARVRLCGVLVESDGAEVITVSTDGHRLTRYRAPLAIPARPKGILVPLKAAKALAKHRKAKGPCTVSIGATHLAVALDSVIYQIKIPDVSFPPYGQVIPDHGEVFRTPRAPLLAALKSVQPLAPTRTQTVVLDLSSTEIKISVDNPERGKAEQVVSLNGPARPLRTGFNVCYLIDALEAANTTEVDLQLIGALDPAVVRPVDGDDLTCVVMPTRI